MTDIDERIRHWIAPEIRELSAYVVADPGDCIKLDAMENPYSWPEALKDEWLAHLKDVELNRYPDPIAKSLLPNLRAVMQVPDSMEVMLGNGSDELIQIIMMAVRDSGGPVLAPEPTFVMYRMIARWLGLPYVPVALEENDFSLDTDAMVAAIDQHQPSVVFLAYPNNPTGNLFEEDGMRRILEAAPGLVIVDEAYAAFASSTFMDRLGDFENLLVMRTVSKMGLAGLRLGLLAGPKQWLQEFDKIRLPYNINVLTQASAEFAMAHADVLDEQTARIRSERGRVYEALCRRSEYTVYPSEANFILFRTAAGQARTVFELLKQQGVLIKCMDGAHPALADCLRVTVGTPEENDTFLRRLAAGR